METTIKKATATKALKICGMVLNVILERLRLPDVLPFGRGNHYHNGNPL